MVNLYVPFDIFQFWEHLVDWIFNPFNGSYKFFLEFLIWNNRVPSHFLELIYQNKILFGHISTWGKFNWECWKLGKVGNILKNYSRKEIPKFIFSLRNIVVSLAAAQFRHVLYTMDVLMQNRFEFFYQKCPKMINFNTAISPEENLFWFSNS